MRDHDLIENAITGISPSPTDIPTLDSQQDFFIKDLSAFIEMHMREGDLSIDVICREMGLSRSQLHRKVKAASGLSTSLFIRKIRLRSAAELLKSTALNSSQIAYQIGINSPQNFSKYFAEEFGLSPIEYRKRGGTAQTLTDNDTNPNTKSSINIGYQTFNQTKLMWFGIGGLVCLFGIFTLIAFKVVNVLENKELSTNLARPLPPTSLAVMPFKNHTEHSLRFLGEGFVEDVITHLASFDDLWLLSKTSTEKYVDSGLSIPQISTEIGARYIVEGSIRQFDDKVRIKVQLIDGKFDKHIWVKDYDRSIHEILDLESELALDIARSLGQQINPAQEEKIKKPPTQQLDAFQSVLRGRHLLRNRDGEEVMKALDLFDTAIDLDPNYAAAYTGKAEAYHILATSYSPTRASLQTNSHQVEANALLAIRNDANDAKAHALLASTYRTEFRHKEALLTYEIALRHNVNDPMINYWYALQLRTVGQLESALSFHEKAAKLDPLHPTISAGYAYTAALAGKFDLVAHLLSKDTLVFKNSFLHHYVAGCNHMYQGQYEQALRHFDKSIGLNDNWSLARKLRAVCQGFIGNWNAVQRYLANFDEDKSEGCAQAAFVYLCLDQIQDAVRCIEKAGEQSFFHLDFLADPLIQHHQTHPKIRPILEQYNYGPYLRSQ